MQAITCKCLNPPHYSGLLKLKEDDDEDDATHDQTTHTGKDEGEVSEEALRWKRPRVLRNRLSQVPCNKNQQNIMLSENRICSVKNSHDRLIDWVWRV